MTDLTNSAWTCYRPCVWPHICLSQHHHRRSKEVAFGMGGKWVKQCLLGKEQGRDAGGEGRSLSHPRLLSDKGPAPGKDSVCVLQRAGQTVCRK